MPITPKTGSLFHADPQLDARSLDWARFSAKVCGVKLHIVYDADADRPIYAANHPGANQRHHRRPGDADRAGRHLCL